MQNLYYVNEFSTWASVDKMAREVTFVSPGCYSISADFQLHFGWVNSGTSSQYTTLLAYKVCFKFFPFVSKTGYLFTSPFSFPGHPERLYFLGFLPCSGFGKL